MSKQEEVNFWMEIIKSPGLSALIGAITATLISPFIKWGIEKSRNRQSNRAKLISDVRTFFATLEWDSFLRFNTSDYIHQLLPFMTKEVKNKLNLLLDKYPEIKDQISIANPGITNIGENITGALREAVEESIPKQAREAKIQLGQLTSEYVVLRDDIYKILADLERKWKLLLFLKSYYFVK